jgi:hypothetical protein
MNKKSLTTFLLVTILVACNKNSEDKFTKESISGVSQKGPFINGSSLTVFELDENFSQTGESFNTQIADNLGSFEIEDIGMPTQYAKLKADGFYFNEIKNANSTSPISLYALSDLSDKSTVNVNLLSTLEVSRVEYLIDNGSSFTDAKRQAQEEILNMFFIQNADIPESELLDISADGNGNAILLAISLILQSYRTEAGLSELVANIATDIRTDGILNSSVLGSELINGARLVDQIGVRNNLENKYAALGITTVIPDFEYYINQFINLCTYTFTMNIEYPYIIYENQVPRKNVLADTTFVISNLAQYSFGADMPTGTSLRVVVKPTNPGTPAEWLWNYFDGPGDWTVQNYYPDSQIVSITGSDIIVNISQFHVTGSSSLDLVIYENNAQVPTRVKTIQW